jgi:hypothetical protein
MRMRQAAEYSTVARNVEIAFYDTIVLAKHTTGRPT